VFCEEEAEYDSLCMSEMQCGIVCCAMFYDISYALQILTPTAHWEKQITQLVSTVFIIY
jgi:hypothetical protein